MSSPQLPHLPVPRGVVISPSFPPRLHCDDNGRKKDDSLSGSNLFLQVCHLRNTEKLFAFSASFTSRLAACVYTGNETKFGMNKKIPQLKMTHSDRMINWFTVFLFCFQVASLSPSHPQLALVALLGPAGVTNIRTINKWYIDNKVEENDASTFFIIPMRFLLLNSSMIPISLKVTLEVCKVFYALFIDRDEHLSVVRACRYV